MPRPGSFRASKALVGPRRDNDRPAPESRGPAASARLGGDRPTRHARDQGLGEVTRPAWFPGAVRGAGAALLVAAAGAAVPVLELLVFRRFGSRPVPGPYELDGTLSGGSGSSGHVRWVWLGDSLSAGVGANHADESFPRLTAALVAARLHTDVELTCLAVPGAAVADVLAGQVPAARRRLTDGVTVVVAAGCNDVLLMVRPNAFRAAYADVLEALGGTGASVVAIGVPDLGSMMVVMAQPLRALAGWAARRADNIIRDVATQTGAQFVSICEGKLGGPRTRRHAPPCCPSTAFIPTARDTACGPPWSPLDFSRRHRRRASRVRNKSRPPAAREVGLSGT